MTTVAALPLSDERARGPSDLKMLGQAISLGACAGGLGGLIVGGIGGRLAMLLLRFTTDGSIRGIESDDGFTMGIFDLSSTLSLLLVCTVLGNVGGLIVVLGRPFFARRFALIGWPVAAGAIVGATIIKADGVDFTLLGPKVLAIAMFVLIPAVGALAITWLVYQWQSWWCKNIRRTLIAAVPGLPALLFFPIGIAAAVVSLAWFVALRLDGVRALPQTRLVRTSAIAVFAVLTGLGLMSLSNDITEIL
jgi:hypothetical protein